MVIGQKWLFSVKSGCIIAKKWFYSGMSGFILARWLYSVKLVVFGQSGFTHEKFVLSCQKWLYSYKIVVFGQKWL